MTPQEKYIKETKQYDKYIAWLEAQISVLSPSLYNEPEVEKEMNLMETTRNLISVFISQHKNKHDYETYIDYDASDLSYTTQVIFPRDLRLPEKQEVENIINYWSHIPYVSVEGNYGIEWGKSGSYDFVIIHVDFTKSASDDYMLREILEKLAEWIWQGTPKRKQGDRKYEGVVKPIIVRADCP